MERMCLVQVVLINGCKNLFYRWIRLCYGWKRLFCGWDGLFYGWEILIYGWKLAVQGKPGAGPGVEAELELGRSVGTWVGACVGLNRQGTSGGQTFRSYGWKVHVMDEKSMLWMKIMKTTFYKCEHHFYGWKRHFCFWVVDEKNTLWMKLPKLWKIKIPAIFYPVYRWYMDDTWTCLYYKRLFFWYFAFWFR